MAPKWIRFSAIMIGMSASALMQTIVATALPTIGRLDHRQLFVALGILPDRADRRGRRRTGSDRSAGYIRHCVSFPTAPGLAGRAAGPAPAQGSVKDDERVSVDGGRGTATLLAVTATG